MAFSIPQIGKSLALAVLGGSITITAGALILGLGSASDAARHLTLIQEPPSATAFQPVL